MALYEIHNGAFMIRLEGDDFDVEVFSACDGRGYYFGEGC